VSFVHFRMKVKPTDPTTIKSINLNCDGLVRIDGQPFFCIQNYLEIGTIDKIIINQEFCLNLCRQSHKKPYKNNIILFMRNKLYIQCVLFNAGLRALEQCFSNFVRPWLGKFFFYKKRTRSQQIYS